MSALVSPASARPEIVRAILATAPPGSSLTEESTRHRLEELTRALLAACPDSATEFQRYLDVVRREIALPHHRLAEHLAGRTVLVTGASGCIGSALLEQLATLSPGRLIGVDLVPPRSRVPIAHRQVDVCDRAALIAVMREAAPDLVFHLAAQRDPGLAEQRERETIAINVFGTRNVVEACAEAGVPQLVFSSTGKALRFYTREIYAASKRIAEFLVSDAASRGIVRASAVRFTHVVDNSLVLDKFRAACRHKDVVRVHAADAAFYIQSAIEGAQLLLAASVSPSTDALDLLAIRNLDWPINLLDVAIGVIAQEGLAPLHVAGYDAGYAEQPYPGLYDPAVCGDVSPLLNALEGAEAMTGPSQDVDRVRRRVRLPPEMWRRLAQLEAACAGASSSQQLRSLLDGVSRELLEVALELGPAATLERLATMTARYRAGMTESNRWLDDRVRWWAEHRRGVSSRGRVAAALGARA